jgi:hypothetical protein
MQKLVNLMFLILLISQANLNGLMAFKIIFSFALICTAIFLNIFDPEEKESDMVNPSELKF